MFPYSSGFLLGWRMCSSTPSLLTSLVLKLSGSSSTSPSRLPRMLVENQPRKPSKRAFKPGARIVFINVCPVLKSLPAIGVFISRASACDEDSDRGQGFQDRADVDEDDPRAGLEGALARLARLVLHQHPRQPRRR